MGVLTLGNGHKRTMHQSKKPILQINGQRMMAALHESCEMGKAHPWGKAPTETGMARLTLSDADRDVRAWLTRQVEAIGCKVKVDQMGNMFAIRPGKRSSAPPTAMGSHLDTQPTGGRYDGILGVQAALEALRTMHENNYETEHDVCLVNWTNEEGARFPMITMASGVWAGVTPLQQAWGCREVTTEGRPRTVREELERIGYLGATECSFNHTPLAAHFELHIEQGPVLEATEGKIGVVTGTQGYHWYRVTVKGSDSHAGTTPLHLRSDAMLVASRMIAATSEIAARNQGVMTVGIVSVEPGSVNTIPHTATFTLDARHHNGERLEEMIRDAQSEFDRIAQNKGALPAKWSWTALTKSPPAVFDESCIAIVAEAADTILAELPNVLAPARMVSGASHDSSNTSLVCPTAMIFSPTRKGRSHTPDEYCPPEDCILAAEVLLEAVLQFDRARV